MIHIDMSKLLFSLMDGFRLNFGWRLGEGPKQFPFTYGADPGNVYMLKS